MKQGLRMRIIRELMTEGERVREVYDILWEVKVKLWLYLRVRIVLDPRDLTGDPN